MTTPDEAARDHLLIACYDDWVSLLEASGWVRDTRPGADEDEVRSATVALLQQLIREELIEGGDLDSGFVAWNLSTEESCRKIEQEWHMPLSELHQGHGWWFASTPAGDDIGKWLTEHRTRP